MADVSSDFGQFAATSQAAIDSDKVLDGRGRYNQLGVRHAPLEGVRIDWLSVTGAGHRAVTIPYLDRKYYEVAPSGLRLVDASCRDVIQPFDRILPLHSNTDCQLSTTNRTTDESYPHQRTHKM